jgi:hypothetical protein
MADLNHKVDIKGARLFPFPFMVLGTGFLLAGMGVMIIHPIISLVLIVFGLSIVTAFEGTEIYPASHTYREYNSFLFLKTGRPKSFEGIEKIFINSGRVTQRMYTAHTMSSSSFSNVEYNAYLKFTEGVKVFLFSGRNKTRLIRKAEDLARSLNTSLHDHTGDG